MNGQLLLIIGLPQLRGTVSLRFHSEGVCVCIIFMCEQSQAYLAAGSEHEAARSRNANMDNN